MKLKWKLAISINIILLVLLGSIVYFMNSQVSRLANLKIEDELDRSSRLGLALLESHYPGAWKAEDGKLIKGSSVLNDDATIVDTIKEETGIVSTIFLNDTRIATSILDEQGDRIVGTTASPEVIEKVLAKGLDYKGTATINGKLYKTFYTSIRDDSGKIVGMWFVGTEYEHLKKIQNSSLTNIYIASGIMLILGFFSALMVGNFVGNSMNKLMNDIGVIASGNFSVPVSTELTKRTDEIGGIANSVEHMRSSIKEIIVSIKEETDL
ncbi:MAG TPA: methyl-accepting chemotaxis protein, partial [Bacteroidetes bacterium]|nr:methyl-accepting chemotaxis protein [Bacteroidota bacterium]